MFILKWRSIYKIEKMGTYVKCNFKAQKNFQNGEPLTNLDRRTACPLLVGVADPTGPVYRSIHRVSKSILSFLIVQNLRDKTLTKVDNVLEKKNLDPWINDRWIDHGLIDDGKRMDG